MELSPKTKELRHDKRVQLNYNRGFEELQGYWTLFVVEATKFGQH